MLRGGKIGDRFLLLVCESSAGTGGSPGGAGEEKVLGSCGVLAHWGKVTAHNHRRYAERQFVHV